VPARVDSELLQLWRRRAVEDVNKVLPNIQAFQIHT